MESTESPEPNEQPSEEVLPSNLQRSSAFKSKIDPNIVIAIALTIISLCALFVSIIQTRILVEQQKMSTAAEKAQLWPRLDINFGGSYRNGSYEKVSFEITNVGTGPAIIDDFSVAYQGKTFTTWLNLYESMLPDGHDPLDGVSIINSPPTNKILQSGESMVSFKLIPEDPDKIRSALKALQGPESPIFTICYRSVFNDCWQMKGQLEDTVIPEVIASCEK